MGSMKMALETDHQAGRHWYQLPPECGLCHPSPDRPPVPPSDGEPVGEIAPYVYVASSWRCEMHKAVVATLKACNVDHYDFRNPPGGAGFGWSEVMPTFDIDAQLVDETEYLAGLEHPRALEGFAADFEAMQRADIFVLVLPCGRSAHLELGWAVGAGKRTAILLDGPMVTPELMYKMVDYVAPSLHDLLGWLGVPD